MLPTEAKRIRVDEMSPAQARALLTTGLPRLPAALVGDLLRATGRWALLLRLVNRLMSEQIATGAESAAAAERLLNKLRVHGPRAVDDPVRTWDLGNPDQRREAASATIEAATTLLPSDGKERFAELGIFAEDEMIPLSVVTLLWQEAGGMTEDQTRLLCRDLERLSLITLTPERGGRIALHDVVRDDLRHTLQDTGIVRANGQLSDAVAATLPTAGALTPGAPEPRYAWWQLSDDYPP
ncbi:hypothetical protein ABZ348_02745 [Streptomyces sp. NPDC005963]|uniref:hypothetical protein n=1 Tax=Streptomyces sp. NPDC005963 TaxID=3156721 RepID=UPI0033CF7E66